MQPCCRRSRPISRGATGRGLRFAGRPDHPALRPAHARRRLAAIALGLGLLLPVAGAELAAQTAGIITTVAGSGPAGFGGDGGPATTAQLNGPEFVAVDASGNLFIADRDNHRIRKVAAGTGLITTVAGNGTAGFAGDGGPATSAQLNVPIGVALDASGNLFIAEFGNHRIRKVTAGRGGIITGTETITTVAGTGAPSFGGDGRAATSAQINGPEGIALDANGSLYIADFSNHRIRKVGAGTGLITTVAGTGTAGFGGDGGAATSAQLNLPTGVALDASGNFFIADYFNHRIRKVAAATGLITTVAGTGTAGFGGDGGPATSAQLSEPTGIALDASGNLFITEFRNHRVRKVVIATGLITTVAGMGTAGFGGDGGPATSAQLSSPIGVALDASGSLFIADSDNHRIRKVGPAPATCPDMPPGLGSSLTISQARGRAGDNITFSVSGTPGETAAVGFSRTNSGASYRGQSLSLGSDPGVLFTCQLTGSGSCSQSFSIPPSTSETYFFQAGRSSDPTFQSGPFSLTNGACLTIQ